MRPDIEMGRPVFTTREVIEGDCWIHSVSHDDDDAWQALGMDGAPDDLGEARVIRLDELLKLDPSIAELLTMPRNRRARRIFVGAPWQIEFKESEPE